MDTSFERETGERSFMMAVHIGLVKYGVNQKELSEIMGIILEIHSENKEKFEELAQLGVEEAGKEIVQMILNLKK